MPNTVGARLQRVVVSISALALVMALAACQQSGPPSPTNGAVSYVAGDGLEHAPGVTGELVEVTLPDPDGNPFTIRYEVIDGLAIVGGDMIIGYAEDFETLEDADLIELTPEGDVSTESIAIYRRVCWRFLGINWHCESYRWPTAVVPYTFADDWNDPSTAQNENTMMRDRILDAIGQIEAVTAVRFVPRSGQSDYVRFRNSDGCSSWVGRQGDRQDINLSVACGTGAVVHEILHALGFHHEHVRDDRDDHVQILWDNIQNSKRHNFQKDDLAFDIGTYDYPSIMHYHGYAFCKRDASNACVGPTILTIPAGTSIGSGVLSPLDIRAINLLYPGEPPTLSITAPSPGATYPHRGTNITFRADVHDPEDMTVEVTWASDVEGVLGTGNPLMVFSGDMSYGVHQVSARGVDPQGNSASDAVSIEIVNTPPSVDLYFPMPGEFCVDEDISFRATVIDINELGATLPDADVAWRVGSGAPFATGKTVTRSFASPGGVQIVVRATDDFGAFDEDWVNLSIEPCTNLPPVVAITSPAADAELVYDGYDSGRAMWYRDVTLVGQASDPEDGELSGSALVWTTDRSDIQPALLGTGQSLSVRLYSNNCEGVTHTITLSATDSSGNVRMAVVRIRIWTLC